MPAKPKPKPKPAKPTRPKPRPYVSLAAKAATDKIRTDTFNGKEYLVVPVIALVQGVLQASNADTPELALASEFAKFPAGWNGRPVTMNHPRMNGSLVPANSPEVLETFAFGQVFNAKMENKKLHLEAWLDKERFEDDEKFQAAADRLESGDVVDVSVGLFCSAKKLSGTYKGAKFDAVWEDVVPDHLAILEEGIDGACSIEAGCGAPRANAGAVAVPPEGCKRTTWNEKTGIVAACADAACECGTKCAAQEAVALSGAEEGDEEPIFDLTDDFLAKFATVCEFRDNDSGDLSHGDVKYAVLAALEEEAPDSYLTVLSVFKDKVVYIKGYSSRMQMRDYKINADGSVSLGADSVRVRPVTQFVPVKLTEVKSMQTKADKVKALIAHKATRFTEENRKWLEEQDEKTLDLMLPPEVTSESEEGKGSDPSKPAVTGADTGKNTPSAPKPNKEEEAASVAAGPPAPITMEQYMASAPKEIRQVLESGISMHNSKKAQLIGQLKTNNRCEYTEQELNAMDLKDLERLAKLANVPTFEGANPARAASQADDRLPPAPPEIFPVKAA